MPTTGAPVPGIVLHLISGSSREVGLGEAYDVGPFPRGLLIEQRWQIDCHHVAGDLVDSLADQVLKKLYEQRAALAVNNVFDLRIVATRVIEETEAGQKVYRKSIDISCWSPITRA